MELAMVGLGKMGANMTRRLLRGGHRVVATDRSPAVVEELAAEGAVAAQGLADAVGRLHAPRVVWLMVPSGAPTREVLAELVPLLAADDVVVDGGNSDWREDAGRAEELGRVGAAYVDVGVSGGVHGLTEGYCLMAGGPRAAVDRLRPAFDTLATAQGFAHVGGSGAGHYAKMVHNAIEYGVMESLAEGFELLATAPHGFDLAQVAGLWRHGSVIRSWLMDLTHAALKKDPRLERLRGHVPDSGEGRWAVETAILQEVPAPVLAAALFARFRSRQQDSIAMKLLAALRREFGGHAVVSGEPAKPAGPGA